MNNHNKNERTLTERTVITTGERGKERDKIDEGN